MSKHARNVVILFAHTRILCFLASIGLIIKNDEIYRRVALSSCNYEQNMTGLESIQHSLKSRQRLKRDLNLYWYSFFTRNRRPRILAVVNIVDILSPRYINHAPRNFLLWSSQKASPKLFRIYLHIFKLFLNHYCSMCVWNNKSKDLFNISSNNKIQLKNNKKLKENK